MAKHITKYEATWHPDKHRGIVFVQFEDGSRGRFDANDAAEFCALVAAVRQEAPMLTSKGWLGAGLEEPATL